MYGTPRPVTGTDLIFYMQMNFVLHRKHTSPWFQRNDPLPEADQLWFKHLE
jgi:hypothetical protein